MRVLLGFLLLASLSGCSISWDAVVAPEPSPCVDLCRLQSEACGSDYVGCLQTWDQIDGSFFTCHEALDYEPACDALVVPSV